VRDESDGAGPGENAGSPSGGPGNLTSVSRLRIRKKARPPRLRLFGFPTGTNLPIQFQSKLKLPGVVRCRGPAVIPAVARALAESIHIVNKRRRRSFVETIEEVEAFRDDIQVEPLSEPQLAHQAHIKRIKAVRQTHVARQIAN